MYVCMCVHVCMRRLIYALYVCTTIYMYCMYVPYDCMYCMYVCMYVCMYERMSVSAMCNREISSVSVVDFNFFHVSSYLKQCMMSSLSGTKSATSATTS